MKLTDKQQHAIHTDSKTVLVSAAAGSGKTSVLSQRVTRLVESGVDIDRILVMTFTNAAAAEMKRRIAQSLTQKAAQCGDARLMQQAELVQLADICTFHSFCAKVVRQNYPLFGILPNFRILSETESRNMKTAAFRQLADTMYERQDADFLRLLLRYTKRGNDMQLAQHIWKIFNLAMSKPDPETWLAQVAQRDAQEVCASLIDALNTLCERDLRLAHHLMQRCAEQPYHEGQAGADAQTAQQIEEVLSYCVTRGAQETALKYGGVALFPRLKPKLDEAYHAQIVPLRNEAKECVKRALSQPQAEIDFLQEYANTKQDVDSIINLIQIFSRIYRTAKDRAGVLDYEDLQHFALRALREQPAAYSNVFVDEYQDTNPVQNEIIRSLQYDGLFMVGDVKQSIYKFRLADLTIFREQARDLRACETEGELVLMNENFRSGDGVLHAVNALMRCVMSGEIDYDDSESLIAQRVGGITQVLLCEGEDKYTQTARCIAQQIEACRDTLVWDKKTQEHRPMRYGDVAVLVRSRSGIVAQLKQELDARCIPCATDAMQDADLPELELFLNLLHLACNAAQDIPLLSVMRSFIGGFDEQDFAEIRKSAERQLYYDAVYTYAQSHKNPLAERCANFLQQIDHLTLQAKALALPQFLETVATCFDFELYFAASPNGTIKQAAFLQFLATLQELCASCASLHDLLQSLAQIKKREGAYVQAAAAAQDADCVKIVTVHGSKGLEYPIVFLAGIDTKFNVQDAREDFLVHSRFGILPKLVDEVSFIKRETVERAILGRLIQQENTAEELRILYVAMTRAQDQLYLVGHIKDREQAAARHELLRITQAYEQAQCVMDWVLGSECGIPVCMVGEVPHVEPAPEAQKRMEYLLDEIQSVPPKPLLELQPQKSAAAKLSVSAIKRAQQDTIHAFLSRPTEDDEISGARLGTLLHAFLEWLLQSGSKPADAAQEMRDRHLIDEQEYESIMQKLDIIDQFLNHPIYSRIRSASRVCMEQSFNLRMDSTELGLAAQGETLVQGILDLAFLENNQWVLLDYKTDRVTPSTLAQTAEGYAVQLALYARALTEITGIPVKERILFFLRLGEAVSV